ncbi:MAG: glutamine-synthetase adenylyltransferase, partial [Rhodospirillales bacterium]|nr:glutamine-synthetase adenylyltransferase [Rhodospirillales bacterium]
ADDLIDSYRFLRGVEHRLQMIDDQQTHSLPQSDEELRHVAVFLGYPDTEPFVEDLLHHLRRVERHYGRLFEESPELTAQGNDFGNLVFTGGDTDPDTIHTLEHLGFTNPQAVDATVRGWHHGRYRATRSKRAREILTELMPALLSALGKTATPDAAFMKFDEFLSRLPGGVQLFSMFHSNPELLELVAELMGGAPRLAEGLSRSPSLLEAVLTQDFFDPPPSPTEMDEDLDKQLAQALDYEDVLNITRQWKNDRTFQVGVQLLRGILEAESAALAYSNIAETSVSRLIPRVEEAFAEAHGRIPEAGMVVVAMGKLGSREMTPLSDLDLIFIYDCPNGEAESDGKRPLPLTQYFAKLSQRIINAITAPTNQGELYEVDMRLRPSGKAGPIATSMASFIQYHEGEAWTWEEMALTRARTISGPPPLRKKVEDIIHDTLTRPCDPDKLVRDVAEMRARIDKENHSDFAWEMKYRRGGLVDIEFITQYLLLLNAHRHPKVLRTGTRNSLQALRDIGALGDDDANTLLVALRLWHALQNMLRLTIQGYFDERREGEISKGLEDLLVLTTGADTFEDLTSRMEDAASAVHGLFIDIIDKPAKATKT